MERATDSLGPFFTERAVRNGEGQVSVGLAFQSASFETLQGADLTSGTFPTKAFQRNFSIRMMSLLLSSVCV